MPRLLRPLSEIPRTSCPIVGCDSELYIQASWMIPLDAIDYKLRRKDAISDDWELTCENGHVLDSGCPETDGRPFHLPEVLTRLELLHDPDREDLLEVLNTGWEACPRCGDYGTTGMHLGPEWRWTREEGCKAGVYDIMSPFRQMAAGINNMAATAQRTGKPVGIRGQHPKLVEVDEIEEMSSRLEDLLIPYEHSTAGLTTRVVPLERVVIVCDDCKGEVGSAMGTADAIDLDGKTGYLYIHEGPIIHNCPAKKDQA